MLATQSSSWRRLYVAARWPASCPQSSSLEKEKNRRWRIKDENKNEGIIRLQSFQQIRKNYTVSLSLVSFVPCFAVKGFLFPSSLSTAFSSTDEASPTVPGCWPVEGVGEEDADWRLLWSILIHARRPPHRWKCPCG